MCRNKYIAKIVSKQICYTKLCNKYISKNCAIKNILQTIVSSQIYCKKLCQNKYIAKNCVITNILQVWWKIWGVHFPVWLLQGERAKEPGDVHVPPGEDRDVHCSMFMSYPVRIEMFMSHPVRIVLATLKHSATECSQNSIMQHFSNFTRRSVSYIRKIKPKHFQLSAQRDNYLHMKPTNS